MTLPRAPLAVLAVIALVALQACRPKPTEQVDLGSLEGSTYSNQYFEFAITVPSTWSIQNREAITEMGKQGAELIAGDNKAMKKMLDQANEATSLNLFASFQHEVGAPVTFNPSVLIVAERVTQLPGVKLGKDYLFHARKLLEMSQMDVAFNQEMYSRSISGFDFDVLPVEMNVGHVVKQLYYSTIVKGYALCIISSYLDEDQKSMNESIIDTLTRQ